jgi:multidrug transporter EmrE-like cation transporter
VNILLFVPAIIWLLISALFFACGEFLSKIWGGNPSFSLTVLVVIAYVLGTLSWLPVLLHKNQLTTMGTAWLLLATTATVIIGIFIFQEKISFIQGIGVFLAFVAMIL